MLCVDAAPALVVLLAPEPAPALVPVPEELLAVVVVDTCPAESVVVVAPAPLPPTPEPPVHTGGAESPDPPATELYCGHWLRAASRSELWAVYQLRASDSYELKAAEMDPGTVMLQGSSKVAVCSHERISGGGVGSDE